MDALITAGTDAKPSDPLYVYSQGKSKALLQICGKPMVQWVLDALSAAQTIDRIILVGLGPESGVGCPKLAAFLPDQGGLLQNLRAGLNKVVDLNPQAHHLLTASSDIPGITPEIVDWTVNASLETDHDAYYNVITRQVMEARFPGSRRTFLRLKDVEVCGGDMNVIRTNIGPEHDAVWERIIAARKNVLKQASLIGLDTLIMVMLRLITLEEAVKIVGQRLNIKGRAILCPYAEIGMDVDKPFQLEIMRRDLARRLAT
jgi:hypothetical protein